MSAAEDSASKTAMDVLDVAAFKAVLHLAAVRIPKQDCQVWMKALKGQVLDRPRLKTVVIDPSDEASRLVLLHERITSLGPLPSIGAMQTEIFLQGCSPCEELFPSQLTDLVWFT